MTDASQRWDRPFADESGWRPGRFHPGRIVLLVVTFLIWWPIGFATLIYLIWSGRMDCGGTSPRFERKLNRMQERVDRMRAKMCGGNGGGIWSGVWRGDSSNGAWGSPSGNRAFDEYKAETLRRLEEEQTDFRDFLERLRQAKDKAEFDQFMEQRRRPAEPRPETDRGPVV